MSEPAEVATPGPLRLQAAWRIHGRESGATIHPLRVVEGRGRQELPDADALRAVVAEMVRDELRSELGRRMTGSIRRLVQDEVARIFKRLGVR